MPTLLVEQLNLKLTSKLGLGEWPLRMSSFQLTVKKEQNIKSNDIAPTSNGSPLRSATTQDESSLRSVMT